MDEQLGFDAGAVDYITKPISPPLVLASHPHPLKAASDFPARPQQLPSNGKSPAAPPNSP